MEKDLKIILASSSIVRHKQMENAGLEFEVIVSDVDETPNEKISLKNQVADIAMRKARAVFESTKNEGMRLIIAGDQNMMFDNKMYGKPVDIKEAREYLNLMRGREDIYAYTGNAVILADKDQILQIINVTDIARMKMDDITDETREEYLATGMSLKYCGGISITDSDFIHLVEGRESTTWGMTLEYALDILNNYRK